MALIGNIIWFVFGGLIMGLAWWLAGILCFISIIGIPWGKACFVIGQFTFWPFGKEAVNRKHKSGKEDIGTGTLGLIGKCFLVNLYGYLVSYRTYSCRYPMLHHYHRHSFRDTTF